MKIKVILVCGVLLLGVSGCGKRYDSLKGKWIASTKNQYVAQVDGEGNTVGGKKDYILELDGMGKYVLNLDDGEKEGTYSISEDNIVSFKDESNLLVGVCNIKDNELDCSLMSTHAFKYIKDSE